MYMTKLIIIDPDHAMKLKVCIHTFFDTYLPHLKGVSEHTISSYRDTFTLFLPFVAHRLSIKTDSLTLAHLSLELILNFLNHLETERHNTPQTRNQRLATLKSFAKMILLMYPDEKKIAERILNIPQKRTQKSLIGFLTHEEILKVFESVAITQKDGFRDYTILHLLFDSGARATEIATLDLDYFDLANKTLIILGKGNKYRQIILWPKTAELVSLYIKNYRRYPKPLYRNRLFINQRGEEFTRHGIHRFCKKYLSQVLPPKRLKMLSAAHSFRHSSAVYRLYQGESITEIKNHLGHESVQSTMTYLNLDISRKRDIQKKLIEHTQSPLKFDSKIEELLNWENKKKTLSWLDSL